MGFKESVIKGATPTETEEVKPGLFIQKKFGGYRQIHPAAWDGKIIWKNFILGPNWIRNFVWFAILMFIVWSFVDGTQQYKTFYEDVRSNPIAFCSKVQEVTAGAECTIELEQQGLCIRLPSLSDYNWSEDFSSNDD